MKMPGGFHFPVSPARRRWTAAICLITLWIAGSVTAMPATPSPDETAAHVDAASRALETFARSHDFGDLRSAVDEMVAAGDLRALKRETFVAQRRTFVRGWARVLKVIEQSYDPTYDPNDQKNWPITGLNPAWAPTPEERAREEALLAANPEKLRRSYYYFDVAHIDLLAMVTLRVQLGQFSQSRTDWDAR